MTALAVADITPEVDESAIYAMSVRAKLGAAMPQPTGYNVLLAIYVRPEAKDLGGGKKIFYADKTRDEDKYQGNVALVLALGPDAYTDHGRFPNGPWCKVGDWVTFPAYENQATKFELDGVVLATIFEDKVTSVLPDPSVASRFR